MIIVRRVYWNDGTGSIALVLRRRAVSIYSGIFIQLFSNVY